MRDSRAWVIGTISAGVAGLASGAVVALAQPGVDRDYLLVIAASAAAVFAAAIALSVLTPSMSRWWGRRRASRRSQRAEAERQRMVAKHGAQIRAWEEFVAAASRAVTLVQMLRNRLLSVERWWPEYLSALDRASSLAAALSEYDRQAAITHLDQIQSQIPPVARNLKALGTARGRAEVRRGLPLSPETSPLVQASDGFARWLDERGIDHSMMLYRSRWRLLQAPPSTKRVATPEAEKAILELDVDLHPLPQLWQARDSSERHRIVSELDPLYAVVAVLNAGAKNLDSVMAKVELPGGSEELAHWSKETGSDFVAGGSESAPLRVGESRLLVVALAIGQVGLWGYIPEGAISKLPFTDKGVLFYDPKGNVTLGTDAEIKVILQGEGFEAVRSLRLRYSTDQPTVEVVPIAANVEPSEFGTPT